MNNIARKINTITSLSLIKRGSCVTVEGASCGEKGFSESYSAFHLETTPFQKALLGVGSAFISLANPRRGDMIAAMGETTGMKPLEQIREKMQASDEGRRILNEKPRINSLSVDLNKLKSLREGTIGNAYYRFLNKYDYTPDARLAVRFVDDYELAYVVQRYREVHDVIHTILNMPTNMLGEVTVKWVEGIQTGLPMCVGGAIFGAARLAPKQRALYTSKYLPWAIETGLNGGFLMNVYFEQRWEQPVSDLLHELNIKSLV